MARTVQIQNSDEVMAQFGSAGIYYLGKWEYLRVTSVFNDEEVPLEVRVALVGETIPSIFTKESIERQAKLNFPIPEQSRFIYCHDIIDVLRKVGKGREAETLANIATNYLDMCTISPEFYELVKQ